jgi:Fic family protein
VQGQKKTYQEVRQKIYENIVDETLFIARASEGAVTAEWLMEQPIFIRKKYVKSFEKELREREARLNNKRKR